MPVIIIMCQVGLRRSVYLYIIFEPGLFGFFFLLFVFSNKEPIDVSAASSSELNTRVKGRKCGSRSENVTSSTIIYMGQVFSLFVFLLFVVPLPYNNKRRCQEEMNSSHLTASHPVTRAYFDAK